MLKIRKKTQMCIYFYKVFKTIRFRLKAIYIHIKNVSYSHISACSYFFIMLKYLNKVNY